MEQMETLSAKLDERKEEIRKIDEEIAAIDAQLDELKGKYPKLITPPSPAAKEYLDQAKNSDWYNDEVIVSGDAEALTLTNLTKREKLTERINAAKLDAADLAFKLIEMNEQNSTTFDRDSASSEIADKKKVVTEAAEKMKALDSTQVHFSFSGYRSDFQKNPNAYAIASIALMKSGTPEVMNLLGQRMSYKDLVDSLKAEYKLEMDEKTRDLIVKTYQDLVQKKDDLIRKKND